MLLLPETVARQDGMGEDVEFGEIRIIRLTLGITRIIAQESLDVSILGSADGKLWRLLATFPHKFYCGTYPMVLDLRLHPDVQYLRAEWKMGRWNQDERAPLFEFYLRAEDGLLHQVGKVASDVF
jgi:hypothetical protein